MRLPFVALAALSLSFAPAPLPRPTDREKIQGTWEAVVAEADSLRSAGEEVKGLRLIIGSKKMKFTARAKGETFSDQWRYQLEPLATPKAFRCDFGGVIIYRLERDTLTICWSDGSKFRPKEFTGKTGSGCTLFVFRRVRR